MTTLLVAILAGVLGIVLGLAGATAFIFWQARRAQRRFNGRF